MNESINSDNSSTVERCLSEMSSSLTLNLISLISMDQTRPDLHHNNEPTKYEVTFIPLVISLLIIEQLIRFFKRQDLCRFQDFVINMGASLVFVLIRSFVITSLVYIIYWIHDNYRVIDLSVDSVFTWILTLLLGEFSLYWTHRAMHEINFLWAVHHFHHMAEDLNFSATLRATFFDLFLYDIFALPIAFIIPPQLVIFHIQLGFLYQIWLHNEVIGNLGFIEVLVNTPRQHRIHHGKNRFCIDKNYGTFLMIWDRLFGTYQKYQNHVRVGLVGQTPRTYDSIALQFGYYKQLIGKFIKIKGFGNKISVFIKGPGWEPGTPRLGIIEKVPEHYDGLPKYGYNHPIPYWKRFYALIHISVIFLAFMELVDNSMIVYTSLKGFVAFIYIMLFLTTIGTIFDNRQFGPYVEFLRCFTYFGFEYLFVGSMVWQISDDRITLVTNLWIFRLVHIISILFWFIHIIHQIINNRINESKTNETNTSENTKDVEECTQKETKEMIKKLIFTSVMFLILISFMIAFAMNMKSCENLFKQIISNQLTQ